MNHLEDMLGTHPRRPHSDRAALAECIRACFECADACTTCADACLGEPKVAELVRCIRLNLDCSDVCVAAGNLLCRQTEPDSALLRAQLEACATACGICGEECARHGAHHEHCRLCAESCRRCEEACRRMVRTLG